MEKYYFYLRHGLWNVVRGLLQGDGPVDLQDKLSAERLLWSAAEDPHSMCFASQIIEFPWHQSWLASLLMQNIKTSGMDKSVISLTEVEAMKKDAEFQSILNRLSESVSERHIIEELLHLYNLVIHAERVKESVPALSAEAQKFICDYFLQDPVTANTILQHLLCVWCPYFSETDDDLQNIYSQALELCVFELNHRTSRTSIEKSDALSNKSINDLCSLVLCIISIFEMSEEKENAFLEHFCPLLLDLSECGVLPREQLLMSMVSRKRMKMAKMFIDLEDRNSARKSLVIDTGILETVYEKLLNLDGSIKIEEMFLRVMKREKHWTEDFVETSGLLVTEGKTDLVEKFLSNQSMKKLWPLVLLHTWKKFSDNDELFSIIGFLIKKCKEAVGDPVFLSLCLAIEHQILVIQWCKKYGQKFSLNNRDFLELAREHSTLEVLRRTTNLENLEWNEARNLLLLGNKTVNLNPNEQNLEGITNWEVTIFDGFCILRKVFAVLQASMEIEQLGKQINRYKNNEVLKSVIPVVPAFFIEKHPSVILRHPSLESEGENCSDINIEILYKDQILKPLEEIKTMLSQLYPLSFRVEILENIFSLLFLRYEDFQEETSSESGAEDYDGDHERLHKVNQSKCCESLDNVSSLGYVTHNMNNFEPVGDVSSSLRTMPVIEAHISGSPPLDFTETFSADIQDESLLKNADISVANAFLVSELFDMTAISVSSRESQLNLSHSGTQELTSFTSSFTDKFTSSLLGACTSSPTFKNTSFSNTFRKTESEVDCIPSSASVIIAVEHKEPEKCNLESREHKKSTKSNRSEITNAPSGTSNVTVKGSNQGFVCNRHIVHNILRCLKDCSLETNSAIYSALSKENVSKKNIRIESSIPPESEQEHIKRLLQYVNDAAWRLELLTGIDISSDSYQSIEIQLLPPSDGTQLDWLYVSEESESEDEDDCSMAGTSVISNRTQKPSYKRSKSENEKSSESGSQSNKSAVGATSSASSYQRSRWSKSHQIHNLSPSSPNAIVNMLLSSHSSLLVRCLTNGEIEKAKQVIKMYGMENNPLVIEVRFLENYHNLITKLNSTVQMNQVSQQQTATCTKGIRKTSTLESIKEVACAGIQSTSLTNQVESFLSITPIPGIQGAERIMKDFPNEASMLQGIDNTAAMTALDLALTISASYEQTASLLDLVCKRCEILQHEASASDMSHSRSRTRNVATGYVHFGANVIKLLKETNKMNSSNNVFPCNISLADLLCSEHYPLSLRAMKDCIGFWNSLHEAVVQFRKTLEDASDKKTQNCSSKSAQKHTNKDSPVMKPFVTFRRLVEIFKDSFADDRNQRNYMFYLQQLYSYLKLVTLLVHQNLPSDLVSSSMWTRPGMYFDILDDSLVFLLGQLIFDLSVPPDLLEPIAQKLKLNLVYNIVCNCCPKIATISSNCTTHSYGYVKKWGNIVLNEFQHWDGTVRHPEVAVRSLLADVLQVIQEQSDNLMDFNKSVLNYHHLCAVTKNSNVNIILMETQELCAIDINLLSPGDETFVFYVNLANLMWIHSVIALEVMPSTAWTSPFINMDESNKCESSLSDNFGLYSSHSLERQISRKCVGYNVGQLGFLSLHDVHQLLLGELSFPPASALKSYTALGSTISQKAQLMNSVPADPRVLFALMNDHKQSPKVQILFVESLDAQLDTCITDFLNQNVQLNIESRELVIPELLQLYQDYVLLNQEPESNISVPSLTSVRVPYHFSLEEDDDQITSLYTKERLSQLIEFLRDNTSGNLQSHIMSFLEAMTSSQIDTAVVTVEKSAVEFAIVLDYGDKDRDQKEIKSTSGRYAIPENIWKHRTVEEPVIKFLECHCWMLSLLVQKIHTEKMIDASPLVQHHALMMTDERTKCLEQLFRSKWVKKLKACFHNNSVVAALQSEPEKDKLWSLLDSHARTQEWIQCAEILWALPETDLMNDPKLQIFHDVVMFELASKLPTEGNPDPWWYCQQIGDIHIQAQCLLQHLPQWPGHGCQEALKAILENHQNKLSSQTRLQLEQLLHKISIYEKIIPFSDSVELKNWYDVSCASEKNPSLIMDLLLDAKEVCLMWLELHDISTKAVHLIDAKFFHDFLESESSNFSTALKLLLSVPIDHNITVCRQLILLLKSIPCLKFLTNFLLNSCTSYLSAQELEKYQILSIGIQMLATLTPTEQSQHMELIWHPHLLIEQYIMNTRLEVLQKMVSEVKPLLLNLPETSPVSITNIDFMLRHYAGKALDFRVIQKSTPCCTPPTDEKLLGSLSLISNQSLEFKMPAVVPTKSDWTPNEEVTECTCCKTVSFSMFYRRHHCRRCGRVICGSCSMKRTKVLGYSSLSVRVCDDCYQQMESEQYVNQTSEDHPPFSLHSEDSLNRDFIWKLTGDETHNSAVREEFSFEYAPSVSLCLAILELHSEHLAFPSFLLNACDQMLQNLQPLGPGTANPEVDYNLVIRMVKSLAVAAKMSYSKAGLISGVEQCDDLLRRIDLLNMLVKNGCSALIPVESLKPHSLRRLRDHLLQEEQWTLALDVSTKNGMDCNRVWAAWGKACLRAGCWKEAWEKFTHCFDKVSDTSRPAQNPLLLNDIIQILEEGAYSVDHKVVEHAEKIRTSKTSMNVPLSTQALSILHTLSALKEISQGKYLQGTPPMNTVVLGPKLDHAFYNECCRYLMTYGSHSGIISFYLRHDDLTTALRHILTQKVEPELFLQMIYLPSLREGTISNLHLALSSFDDTLVKWKVYLGYVCCQLDRMGMFNVLYQLQLYIKDYVRATITCTRFYKLRANSYTDLYNNLNYLEPAKCHLREEIEDMQRRKSSYTSLESRGKNTPQLAMKVDQKYLVQCLKTIELQETVNKYFYECENEQQEALLPEKSKVWCTELEGESISQVPTLFDNTVDRIWVALTAIISGKDIEKSFHISFSIITLFNLNTLQVYGAAAKKWATEKCHEHVIKLTQCIKSSTNLSNADQVCDDILLHYLDVLGRENEPGKIDHIVRLITNVDKQIKGNLSCRQLMRAFVLAAKKSDYEDDVKTILHEAERLGQMPIVRLCKQKLGQRESK